MTQNDKDNTVRRHHKKKLVVFDTNYSIKISN